MVVTNGEQSTNNSKTSLNILINEFQNLNNTEMCFLYEKHFREGFQNNVIALVKDVIQILNT